MNIQRYLIPVSAAAAIHAALFFCPTNDTWRPVAISSVAVPPPPPELTPEPLTVPPDPEVTTEPVQPLAHAPSRPTLDETTATAKVAEWPAETPVPPSRTIAPLSTIPIVPGDGNSQVDGPDFRNGNPIFTVRNLDRVPAARVQMPPDYPVDLKTAGISGSVTVEFVIDPTGAVVRAQVVRSSNREFEAPALRAVMKWRFEPGRRNGRPVPFRLTVPIDFAIDAS